MAEKINNLMKIRSKYIIIKIFNNIKQSKLLNIINYNKSYQKLMNIKLKDYKNEFSKIEIEIIPEENIYGRFIKFYNQNIKSNIHIYFNDNNKEEIKRNKVNANDNVTKIKIIIDYKIKSLNRFFQNCKCIKKIKFIKFTNNDIKDMSDMFEGCSSLNELNLSNFNTKNVINMSGMFQECSSLKELNLSNFNTNNVTDMSCMFEGCSSLNELNLSNFNTKNVTDMSSMFYKCSSLKELDLSNFITNNVTNMNFMFYKCSSLKELNISNFNSNSSTDMFWMFIGCSTNLSLICKDELIKKEYEDYLLNKY